MTPPHVNASMHKDAALSSLHCQRQADLPSLARAISIMTTARSVKAFTPHGHVRHSSHHLTAWQERLLHA